MGLGPGTMTMVPNAKPDAGIACCPPVFVVEKGSDALFVEVGDRNIEPIGASPYPDSSLAGSHFEAGSALTAIR